MKHRTDTTAPLFDKAWKREQYHRDLAEQQRQMLEDLKRKELHDRNGRGRSEASYQFRSTHGIGQSKAT